MRTCILILGLIGLNVHILGQSNSNEAIREKFAFEVIHIDEFMERFNFDEETKLMKYLSDEYDGMEQIDRSYFLRKLIKLKGSSDQALLVDEFVNFVDDSLAPHYLSYYDTGWYAELSCKFAYQSKEVPGDLILSPQFDQNETAKWVINRFGSDKLLAKNTVNNDHILNPVSHNVDFAGLYNCLADKENLLNYFEDDFVPDPLTEFYMLLKSGQIELKRIDTIRYFFLQIPGWIFKVEYAHVSDLQSGWLITELVKVSEKEKEAFRCKYLN